ncbi:MAG TPA: hypothetical protein EYP56_03250, partial [Planctomycetaceae bacterium]|nr:hypothetical protein [Planctomycetaceae bacterium]
MIRTSCCRLLTVASLTGVLAALVGANARGAGRPPAPALLPEDTAVLVSVLDVRELVERFSSTSLGRLLRDPQVKPILEHLYGSTSQQVARARDRIGLSLEDLLSVLRGELSLAVVAREEQRPGVIVLIDAGERIRILRELMRRAGERLEQNGADRSEEVAEDTPLVIYRRPGAGRPEVVWFEKDGTLAIGSSAELLRGVL